jgi:hypothetical protein
MTRHTRRATGAAMVAAGVALVALAAGMAPTGDDGPAPVALAASSAPTTPDTGDARRAPTPTPTTTTPDTTPAPTTTTPAPEPAPVAPELPAPTTTPAPPPAVTDPCMEDEPCWDCSTMGNGVCGPVTISVGACIVHARNGDFPAARCVTEVGPPAVVVADGPDGRGLGVCALDAGGALPACLA